MIVASGNRSSRWASTLSHQASTTIGRGFIPCEGDTASYDVVRVADVNNPITLASGQTASITECRSERGRAPKVSNPMVLAATNPGLPSLERSTQLALAHSDPRGQPSATCTR